MNNLTKITSVILSAVNIVSCAAKEKIQQKQSNVLMICVDDLNHWLGCMLGHPNAITPNMDKLAGQGVLFTNAHCQAPICGSLRNSVALGLSLFTVGVYGQIG